MLVFLCSFNVSGQSTESNFEITHHTGCDYLTASLDFTVPIDEDKYDGLVDGKEFHTVIHQGQDVDDDTQLKYSFLKIHQIDTECDDREYFPTFIDNFNMDELNLDNWVQGFRNETPPFDLVISEANANALALPEFTTVEDGLLRLRMGTNNTGFNTVTFPREGGLGVEETFRNGAGAIVTNTDRDWRSAQKGGCLRYGRYTIRAKAMPVHNDRSFVSTVWFYGWPGEVDLFEQCLNGDCNNHKATFHQWSVDDGNVGQHYDLLYRNPNAGGDGEHIYYQKKVRDKGKYADKFVNYQLEWTPYEMIIRYDDKEVFTLSRYWSQGLDGCTMKPLTCDQIPSGVILNGVFELITWNRWREHFMDLVLNTDIPIKDENIEEDQFFEIDWIKFEHKTDNALIEGPDLICDESDLTTFEYRMTFDDVIQDPITWSFAEEGVVPRTGWNQNPLRIFSIPEGLSEINLQVQTDNMMSCMDYNVTGNIKVGPPAVTEFRVENRGCGGAMVFGNYPTDIGDYEWEIIPTKDIPLDVTSGSNWVSVLPVESGLRQGYGFQYILTLTNRCGTKRQEGFHWVQGCREYKIQALSNPFSDVVRYVVYENEVEYMSEEDIDISLFDADGNLKFTDRTKGRGEIPSESLKEGIYYLSASIPGVNEMISTMIVKN